MKWFHGIRERSLLQPPLGLPWRQALPGLLVLGLVVGARLLGLFQGTELKMLDTLLRWRPAEPTDERILIVGITEADIQALAAYPVSDALLADLIQTLSAHQPRAIGLDIFRDKPVGSGYQTLVDTLQATPQVIAINSLLSNPVVAAPDFLPPEQVGFADLPLDQDGFVRQVLLGLHGDDGAYHRAFSLRLAEIYLHAAGLTLRNGRRDPQAMRFGDTELNWVRPHTGGYIRTDGNSYQMLLNPRSGPNPFRTVSLQQVMRGEVNPAWIEDAIVLIGVTAITVKDVVPSAAIVSEDPGGVYGVEFQAHATSQIVNAVMEDRPLLRVWPNSLEYLWIVAWGVAAMGLVRWITSPSWYLLVIGLMGLGLVGIGYGLLWLGGWWIPLVPTLVVLTINGLVLPGFWLYDQRLRSQILQRQRVIEERQRVIEQTYSAIHNGPLQTLALILQTADPQARGSEILPRLHQVNHELRAIYEGLLATPAPVPPDELTADDSQAPLHEQLYEIYNATLRRDFPGFQSIGLKVVDFEPLDTTGLSPDDSQALCWFLEEALCNVGKHAVAATRLTIKCGATPTENYLQVEDNGQAKPDRRKTYISASGAMGGRGTRQARQLAHRLRGTFRRVITPTGTCCELRWAPDASSSRCWDWLPWR